MQIWSIRDYGYLRAWIFEGKLIVPFTGGDRKYNPEMSIWLMDKTLSYFNEWNDSSLLDCEVKWINFSTNFAKWFDDD